MNEDTTYDVRVYLTEVYKGVKVTTYRVRRKAGKRAMEGRLPNHRTGRQLPQRPAYCCPEGRGIQSRHGQADRLEEEEGRHYLVRLRLRVRRYEVEASLCEVPEGHRPRTDCGNARDAGTRTRTARGCQRAPGAGAVGIQHEAAC